MSTCLWNNCNLTFANGDDLKNHIDMDHIDSTGMTWNENGKPVFKCLWKDCPKADHTFNHRYRLARHTGGVHCKQKSHKCNQCDKAFSYVEGLRDHKRIHTGEKPYTCRVAGCEMKFRTSSDRVKHQRSHEFVQFNCPTCDYICHTKVTLSRHHRRVHGQKLPKMFESNKIDVIQSTPIEQASPVVEQEPLLVPESTFDDYYNNYAASYYANYGHTYQYDQQWYYPSEHVVPQMDQYAAQYSNFLH